MMNETDIVLATRMRPKHNGAGAKTIRDYLTKLLLTLWRQADGFSGKRPFGNSGWDGELAKALVVAGLVQGTIDSDGYLVEYDDGEVDNLITDAIERMGRP